METKAIVLVAGMGTRLKPLTIKTHKCLTMVNGIPIIFNALEQLWNIGVKVVVLVVGYLAENIEEQVGDHYKGMNIQYITNTKYSETNTSYSLKLGMDAVGSCEKLYILEGDVFFEGKLLDLIENSSEENVTLVERYKSYLDGTFVALDEKSYVVDWTHKSMREEGYVLEDKYKTINIHKFSRKFLNGILKEVLEKICEETNGKAPLENVMNAIVREHKHMIYGLECGEAKWFEIDDVNDLKMAEKIFME